MIDFFIASAFAQSASPVLFTRDAIGPTLLMVAIACLGGVANFIRKMQAGQVRPFNIAELVGEIVVSGFAGLLAYFVFRALGVGEYLTAAGVGVVGHMGSRALFIAEKILEDRARKAAGLPEEKK